jgi:predicted nuclease of restriction endonuclease-like (RecB) superfamily
MRSDLSTQEYKNWIQELKQKFQSSQIKASIAVNSTLLEFYWNLGSDIVEKQKEFNWGSDFLKQLSKDLSNEFPDIKGFSVTNLSYIRRWVLFYIEDYNIATTCGENQKSKSPQLVAKLEKKDWQQIVAKLIIIPWGHNRVIISKCKDVEEALFYVNNTIKNGISRSVLIHQIESKLYERQAKAITNFSDTLPPSQSDLAKELLKDPYNFDFLTLTQDYNERELEDALCENITKFLLELGSGFAFVGRQYKLIVGGEEFKIDLLFYHLKLRCYVVVELKAVDFKPEFAGKLNFYTAVVDGEVKAKEDNPTIGILICKSKNDLIVEYALKGVEKPLGISEYELTEILPKEFKSSLPTVEELENELNKELSR